MTELDRVSVGRVLIPLFTRLVNATANSLPERERRELQEALSAMRAYFAPETEEE